MKEKFLAGCNHGNYVGHSTGTVNQTINIYCPIQCQVIEKMNWLNRQIKKLKKEKNRKYWRQNKRHDNVKKHEKNSKTS